MRMRTWIIPFGFLVIAGESQAQSDRTAAFLEAVRSETAGYRDSNEAVRDGFRPIGPDAPGMGRHWVNIGRVLDNRFEPGRPSILTYIQREGQLELVGVAFAIPLSPGESAPGPFPQSAWHIHAGSVADEGALFGHDMAPTDVQGERGVAVLHVWAWAENPGGLVAADNWALPFLRRGLDPPTVDPGVLRIAALGLALADGADEFIIDVLTRHYLDNESDKQHARRTLRHHAQMQRTRIGSGAELSAAQLAEVWNVCWHELVSGLSGEGRSALRPLAGQHSSHQQH